MFGLFAVPPLDILSSSHCSLQWDPDFFEPPWETETRLKNRVARDIGGKINYTFELPGDSKRRKGSINQDSTVIFFSF